MSNNYYNAIEDLKNARNVKEWNTIRAKWLDVLSQGEISLIDSGGLIVELLGRDKKEDRHERV
jgi:hypothetical protein